MNASRCVSVAGCGLFLLTSLFAGDWPQWRGPGRDGRVPDAGATLSALPTEPKAVWRISVGNGQSAPVVAGSRLVYLDEQSGKEVAHCVDLAGGREIWRTPYGDIVEMTGEYGNGPRCAPLVDGERLYVQSCGGEFRCLSLADGKVIWGVSFGKDFGATWFGNRSGNKEANETAARRHGHNGSAVIDGDRIFVPVGDPQGATLVCFDKKTGKKLWQAGQDNTAYSSVMVATLGGVRQVVHYTADALMGVDAASGKMLWRFPIKTGAKRHTVTPILSGDTVTVASHSVGLLKYRISKDGAGVKAVQDWVNPAVQTMLSTPVLIGGHLYGLGTTKGKKSDFVCIDFQTGKEVWKRPAAFDDYASLLVFGERILALNSSGEAALIKASPGGYEELGRVQFCAKTWSFPAYADGRLYVRDGKQIVAMELASARPTQTTRVE